MNKNHFKTACLICILLPGISSALFAQNVGIGTLNPNTSAALDITSPSKGLLIPRMTTTGINSISNPAKDLLVYDSLLNQLVVNMGTATSPNWQTIIAKSGWALNGNSGINASNQFIGSTDNQPLRFRVNNIMAGEVNPVTENIFWGLRAGQGNTTGFNNIAIGTDALKLNTNIAGLIGIGDSALFANTAPLNTAIGSKSLFSNTSGDGNTAIGFHSLLNNTGGFNNTANGMNALSSNTIGSNNTANGTNALIENTFGNGNTANGEDALHNNSSASGNTAIGNDALFYNTTGDLNVAVGDHALYNNNSGTGEFNTAIGISALYNTNSSSYNTAIGANAGANFNMGYNNTILGANCDVTQAGFYNCIAIGQGVTCFAPNMARIGNSATNSIGGYVNWTNFSDGRYKKNLKENVMGLDFIMKLRPVTYNLDVTTLSQKLNESRGKAINSATKLAIAEKEKVTQTGFIAQEVEKAAKETGYDFSGVDKPNTADGLYGLRYAEFVVPLVKAMQEQQQMINELKKQNDNLQKRVLDLEKK